MIEDLSELLTLGYSTTRELAKRLETTPDTVKRYLPNARSILTKLAPSRDDYRAEHIMRLRQLCEMVVKDLETLGNDGKAYERAALYRVLGTFMGQLALVTGLNVETQVQVEQKQLVIIRNPAEQKLEARQTGEVVLRQVESKAKPDAA